MKYNNKNLSFTSFLKSFFAEVTNVDNRISKTLITLLSKPGELTSLHFNSSDEKYIPPIRFYFIINFIFFILIPILNSSELAIFNYNLESFSRGNQFYQTIVNEEIQKSNVTQQLYEERFNTHLKYIQPAFVFLIVPIFALLIKIIFLKKKKYYLEHLIFALHYLSFFLFSLLLSLILFRISKFVLNYLSVSNGVVAAIILILLIIWLSIYLFISLRTFYKNTLLSNIIAYPFVFIGFIISLGVYAQYLFFHTLLALEWNY